jgi:uncharacterized protein YndB with AHSA1/START domain
MTTRDAANTIEQEITINAPIARVFRAVTDPTEVAAWWGSDDSYRVTGMTADLRVGGSYRTVGIGSDGLPFAVTGVYRVVDLPHAVEYTWRYEDEYKPGMPETVVRYELSERDGATHVRVIHWGFATPAQGADYPAGWLRVLGWMRDYVEAT